MNTAHTTKGTDVNTTSNMTPGARIPRNGTTNTTRDERDVLRRRIYGPMISPQPNALCDQYARRWGRHCALVNSVSMGHRPDERRARIRRASLVS
jgi:hypothetical protein